MLQEAGAIVRIGIPNLKVHCKVILVTRRKKGKVRRFGHVARAISTNAMPTSTRI